MKLLLITLLLMTAPVARPADSTSIPLPAPLFEGLGNHQHPITTRSPDAQRFFDQGLTLAYGFTRVEAIRSFEAAAQLDPQCAMAYFHGRSCHVALCPGSGLCRAQTD